MPQITEKIIVNTSVHLAYKAYYEIENWTKILSDVTAVDVLVNKLDYQEFYMSVIKRGVAEKVHTIRRCKINNSIEITQPTPPPQVEYMSGVWEFISYNNTQTIICATKKFEVKDTYNAEEYISDLRISLLQNITHFKNYLEGVGTIQVQKILNTSAEQAIKIFWDLENWNKIWNPIIKTHCSFDNNFLQEFTMRLEHNNQIETITGIQVLKKDIIEFYNIECPYKLAIHLGEWKFENTEHGVLVTANRIFKMEEEYSSELLNYKFNLQNRINKILDCFKEYFLIGGDYH